MTNLAQFLLAGATPPLIAVFSILFLFSDMFVHNVRHVNDGEIQCITLSIRCNESFLLACYFGV